MLDLNFSLFFITFLIALLYFTLDRCFFRPIGKIVSERENKIRQDNQTLSTVLGQVQDGTRSLEMSFLAAQRDAARIKEELIQKGEEIRRQMVGQARENAQRLFAEKMEEMDRQVEETGKELEKQIHIFSAHIKEAFL